MCHRQAHGPSLVLFVRAVLTQCALLQASECSGATRLVDQKFKFEQQNTKYDIITLADLLTVDCLS